MVYYFFFDLNLLKFEQNKFTTYFIKIYNLRVRYNMYYTLLRIGSIEF